MGEFHFDLYRPYLEPNLHEGPIDLRSILEEKQLLVRECTK
jgi:hypothetical protein